MGQTSGVGGDVAIVPLSIIKSILVRKDRRYLSVRREDPKAMWSMCWYWSTILSYTTKWNENEVKNEMKWNESMKRNEMKVVEGRLKSEGEGKKKKKFKSRHVILRLHIGSRLSRSRSRSRSRVTYHIDQRFGRSVGDSCSSLPPLSTLFRVRLLPTFREMRRRRQIWRAFFSPRVRERERREKREREREKRERRAASRHVDPHTPCVHSHDAQ